MMMRHHGKFTSVAEEARRQARKADLVSDLRHMGKLPPADAVKVKAHVRNARSADEKEPDMFEGLI